MKGLLRYVNGRKRLSFTLLLFSFSVSALIAAAFVGYTVYLLFFLKDYIEALRVVITAGVPFFTVGALRAWLMLPRPFEVYPFYEGHPAAELFGGEKKSGSFPSRHAYSSFVIGTVFFFVNPWCALIFGVPAVLMCACRALLGIHFVRDLLAGALIGILSGVLGEFLLRF